MRPDLRPDMPGQFTDLSPELTPRWMRRLVDGTHAVRRHPDLRRVDARGRKNPPTPERTAAVLMLFSGDDHFGDSLPDDAAVLLTHRSPTLRSHSGQIAFPGGRIDRTDRNPVDTALREAWEETGLDRSTVTPVAELDPVHIIASGFDVHPVVGHWHTPGGVGVTRPSEADDVFPAHLSDLVDPDNRLMVEWSGWKGPAFTVNDYLVWGFTACLLSAMLDEAGWGKPWDTERSQDLGEALAKSRNEEPRRPGPGHRVGFLR